MEFKGKWLTLPWSKWNRLKISPDGIMLPNGVVVAPVELETLLWKAAFYDRSKRVDYTWEPGVDTSVKPV